jgi:hypothetical protein
MNSITLLKTGFSTTEQTIAGKSKPRISENNSLSITIKFCSLKVKSSHSLTKLSKDYLKKSHLWFIQAMETEVKPIFHREKGFQSQVKG